MSWARAFLPVPTGALIVDPQVGSASGKASVGDMQSWMRRVPEIYLRIQHGETGTNFDRMASAPQSTHERELGETYRHLFSESASAAPIRADLCSDGQLVVQAGQHRVRAAQQAGIPVLPVHVAAPDQVTLGRLREQIAANLPTDPHIRYDAIHRAFERDPSLVTDRQADAYPRQARQRERRRREQR